ncbi:O-methyltransferase family 3 [Leadbetterella byssophila DSM 17132]|uniref:O-methyltransferase family 3 n=1 Tax=Leadbetterella byssophila (strain DSM 17132 / JCM 16389 / KACC 11308 / NBRC 106382 / 4M15) TaxID=649349 RepID=E4RY83_LEAB4|nr:class I SAM-dependent methyltransferase [Leadbetterella byssophila]ADQ17294.1 O-methyltransferase family 3 [Leadbetterella byssophila DSM 17132]
MNVENYCQEHSSAEPEILAQINRDTHAHMLKPRMLSGHYQGRLLSLLSKMLQPKNILEIGTFTGYSALCLAEGLTEGGKLYTIEAEEEFEDRIRKNIEAAGKTDQIELIIGQALDVIPQLPITFDMVFIDADKLNYIKYYQEVIDKVRIGGVILTDNVLWSGKVIDESKKDATTELLREFNAYVSRDPRTEKVLLPVRDGLFLTLKIK